MVTVIPSGSRCSLGLSSSIPRMLARSYPKPQALRLCAVGSRATQPPSKASSPSLPGGFPFGRCSRFHRRLLSRLTPQKWEVLEICARSELRRLAAESAERKTSLGPLAVFTTHSRGLTPGKPQHKMSGRLWTHDQSSPPAPAGTGTHPLTA
jgi:hypothetical protein